MGKKSSPEPDKVSPSQSSGELLDARTRDDPKLARVQTGITQENVEPLTKAFLDARTNLFQPEEAVRQQLLQNTLQQLISPTGITAEQQQAQDALRGKALDAAAERQQTRANLGGGLFGGRSAQAEQEDLNNLQFGFTESDINREERTRQNALQNALQSLQLLFPQVGLQGPTLQTTAPGGDTAFTGAINQNQFQAKLELQQQALNDARQQALFKTLGTVLGGADFGKALPGGGTPSGGASPTQGLGFGTSGPEFAPLSGSQGSSFLPV